MSFSNKVVLVTGAASGIGEAIAYRFGRESANLALVDVNEAKLKKSAQHCRDVTENVLDIVADLTRDDDVKNCVDAAIKKYGKIDVLINSAGIYGFGRILDEDIMEAYDKVLAVNLRAAVAVTNAAAKFLVESRGVIINISSIAAVLTMPDIMPYNVAKAALTHFTKCVALELSSKGVRANTISPGAVKTNILTNAGLSAEISDDAWSAASKAVPLKRLIDPSEIAELATFLASDKGVSITGSDFVVDAGIVLTGPQQLPDVANSV